MTTINPAGADVAAIEDLPLMLTVEEAAGVLRVGRNTAYAAVADGLLPAVRIGNRIRIPRAGLAALVDHDPGATSHAPGMVTARSTGGVDRGAS